MLKRLHKDMTLFCTAVTGLILAAMSAVCLLISYNGLKESGYASFLNDLHTIFAHMETQSDISHQWISQMEKNGRYLINIVDNGTPLYFDRLKHTQDEQTLLAQAASVAKNDYALDITAPTAGVLGTNHTEFRMKGVDGEKYEVSVGVLAKSGGALGIIVLYPFRNTQMQLMKQGMLFLAVDLAALMLLAVFSWFFTRKTITPIKESQQKQAAFVAAASHELRTPLTVILSCLSAMKRSDGNTAAHFAENAIAEGMRMSRLIDDLLLLSHADSHEWTMQTQATELDTLLLDAYEKFSMLADQKKLRLKLSLPDGAVPVCMGDPERIAQVLSILLDNACSYTPEGGTVAMRLTVSDKAFEIHVTDNGPGIPDKQKHEIFERFARGDSSRSSRSHFGLGLCIAKEIVTQHHGVICVEDAPGGGADFIVKIHREK